MQTTSRTLVALATLAVVGATGLLGLVRATPVAAATNCVAVLVDFRQLGGDVRTGCAQGDPDTGLQALDKAGFAATPRPRDGLICQIDSTPACTDTTSSTYWSYWYRSSGSATWVYANEGAGTHDPRPGSTEAWVWQDGGRTKPPSIGASSICPQLKKPTATSSPEKTKPPSSSTASTQSSTTSAQHSAAASKPKPTQTQTQTQTHSKVATASPGTTQSSVPDRSSASGTSPPALGDVKRDSGGGAISGPMGIALGGVLVAGLGTATAVRARKRRTS